MIIRRVILILVVLFLALPGAVLAGEQDLQKAAKIFSDVYGQGNVVEIMKNVKLLKDAGLSYQKSLAIPLEEVIDCKDQEGLRVLYGMYAFDENYAMVFGKRKEFLETLEVINSQVLDRLDVRDKLQITPVKPELLKDLLEDPENVEKRDVIFNSTQANIDAMLKQAASDPEVMDVLIDAIYGTVIQGLYVACELALNNESGDKMIALFNAQAQRVEKFNVLLDTFKDPELSKMVEWEWVERGPLIDGIQDLIKSKKGRLNHHDIEKILAAVKPVRNYFARKCWLR